jgi:hypothetical protein
MDNTEKLATQGTQYEEKHNTICVTTDYTQTNTNNVDPPTGGKDEQFWDTCLNDKKINSPESTFINKHV